MGLHLPTAGPLADSRLVRETACLAESIGFDSVWLLDRLLTPVELGSNYPYTPTGDYLYAPELPFFEALSTMAYVAGCTDRITIGTAVTVPALKHPLHLARFLATLDTLCAGRLVLGAGAGWMREEFEAMDLEPSQRGSRLEELVAALRAAWDDDVSSFDGDFFHWPEAGLLPRPYGGRRIPVLIGGHSDAALKRAARIGDGWAITLAGRTRPDVEGLRYRLASLGDELAAVGRARDDVHVHLFTPVDLRPWGREDPRPLLRGNPDEVASDVEILADMGVGTLDAYVGARDGAGLLRAVETLGTDLLPRLDQDS